MQYKFNCDLPVKRREGATITTNEKGERLISFLTPNQMILFLAQFPAVAFIEMPYPEPHIIEVQNNAIYRSRRPQSA